LVDTGGDGEHAFAYLALRAAAETLARLTAA
jgi:hypothetical protein